MALPTVFCLLVLSAAASVSAGSPCKAIPSVKADQSPTKPQEYGKCTNAMEKGYNKKESHWCRFNRLGPWPAAPPASAKKCLKFGRMTIYRGPIYGSSPAQKGACNAMLHGGDAAMVALSTKYLKTYQGGWTSDKGACGQCMCIRMAGGDVGYNPGLQKDKAQKHIGLTFLGKVRMLLHTCHVMSLH